MYISLQLDKQFIPADFLVDDISVEGERHLVFATTKQLELLAKAKVWYCDGTFKILKDPFKQLFSIHSFLRVGEETKQIPLAYALMTRRRKTDYKKVTCKNIYLCRQNHSKAGLIGHRI